MSKERTVLLRTTSFSVEAGEAAVGARPATVHRTTSDSDRTSEVVSGRWPNGGFEEAAAQQDREPNAG
jgi:hypothetical protein